MENILNDVPGCVVYIDDILIWKIRRGIFSKFMSSFESTTKERHQIEEGQV